MTKAVVQARLLSGRYRSDKLISHFSPGSSPNCTICPEEVFGTIEHLLVDCSALKDVRKQNESSLNSSSSISEQSKNIIKQYLTLSTDATVQLLLDCSVLPEVIISLQIGNKHVIEEIFRFTRNWCYSMHQRRMQLKGIWTN